MGFNSAFKELKLCSILLAIFFSDPVTPAIGHCVQSVTVYNAAFVFDKTFTSLRTSSSATDRFCNTDIATLTFRNRASYI